MYETIPASEIKEGDVLRLTFAERALRVARESDGTVFVRTQNVVSLALDTRYFKPGQEVQVERRRPAQAAAVYECDVEGGVVLGKVASGVVRFALGADTWVDARIIGGEVELHISGSRGRTQTVVRAMNSTTVRLGVVGYNAPLVRPE